jgi:ubiquinone/menaquinone biosynthesis C-methylase UbiE
VEAVNYDQAAGDYAAHRQVHSGVFHELCKRFGQASPGRAHPRGGEPGSDATVLEVGCGTGNYIGALAAGQGCTAYGLDPSAGMLAQARTRPARVAWLLGRAEALSFRSSTFDLIFSVDVIHHVAGKGAHYREVARVLRPGGWVCTVTDSADIIRRREILSGYFPETVEIELARYPRLAQLEAWMAEAGLAAFEVVTVEQPYQIASAQPFRAKAYSSLHLIADEAWQAGLARLERDLARGPVPGVSRYACLWGQKAAQRMSRING